MDYFCNPSRQTTDKKEKAKEKKTGAHGPLGWADSPPRSRGRRSPGRARLTRPPRAPRWAACPRLPDRPDRLGLGLPRRWSLEAPQGQDRRSIAKAWLAGPGRPRSFDRRSIGRCDRPFSIAGGRAARRRPMRSMASIVVALLRALHDTSQTYL
jgi:hypothetical protein